VLQQRGLADPWLTLDYERPAATCARLAQKRFEPSALGCAPHDRGAILRNAAIHRNVRTEAVKYACGDIRFLQK
jgi:hypothetical protein